MLATEGTYNYLMGGGGDDRVFAYGNDNQLGVCPASSLLTALDLVFFRRATATSADLSCSAWTPQLGATRLSS